MRSFCVRSSAAPISRSAMVVARGSGKLNVPVLMAGSLMSALPAIVVYLIFQRYLISGLTTGMSK